MMSAVAQKKNPSNRQYDERNRMITQYLPHVKRIVNRIAVHLPSTVEVDDLIHVGVIGLMQALERYDPGRDNKFITFASFRIKGAVLSELRSRDYLSRSNRKKVREMEKTYFSLQQKLGRTAADKEVAKEMGIGLEQLHDVKNISNMSFISLEELGFNSKQDKDEILYNLIHNDSTDALTLTRMKEVKQALGRAINDLPDKEKLVVSMYYMDELTMKEIGKVLNLTESRVSQIHSQAIRHLKMKLRKEEILE